MKIYVIIVLALAYTSAFNLKAKSIENLPNGRITNGTVATLGQIPYQVGLVVTISQSKWCGASLLNNEWILTAAHCVDGIKTGIVYLGMTKRLEAKIKVTITAEDVHIHSGYSAKTLSNDIALIKIKPISFSTEIQPIKLPSPPFSTYVGENGTTSGWGKTSETSGASTYLNYATLAIIPNSECVPIFGKDIVTDNNICVATPDGTSPCQGDSGGPLASKKDTDDILIGVFSLISSKGCTKGVPAVFTRVTKYVDWIENEINSKK